MLPLNTYCEVEQLSKIMHLKHNITEYPVRTLPILKKEKCIPVWREMPEEVDSLAVIHKYSKTSIIVMNPAIKANLKRARFTIAHELGHVLLHRFGLDDSEESANEFAACFLMPEFQFKQCKPWDRADYFGTSDAAVFMRIQRMKYLKQKVSSNELMRAHLSASKKLGALEGNYRKKTTNNTWAILDELIEM